MFTSFSEQSIDSLVFYPSAKYPDGLKYLDVKLGAEGCSDVFEGHLYDASIQSWLDDSGKTEASDQGRLRLVLAGRTGHSNFFDHLPFSKETFTAISRSFELPGFYPGILSTKLPHYTHSASKNSAEDETLSFISRTFAFEKAGHALALTFNERTKITSAIIQRPKDSQYLAKMCRFVKERPDMVGHPAYLLVIASQLEYETTNDDYFPSRGKMQRIERLTGHGHLIGRNITHKENFDLWQDLPDITRDLNLFSSRVIGEAERVRSCLLCHQQILQFIDQFDKISSSPAELSRSAELRQHAEFLATGWKSMLDRYEAFDKNIQVQRAVLYNAAVQRDSALNLDVAKSSAKIAAATKHDGSVMKSISLLTMFFLPATFVSTLFAMPLFDWSADRVAAIATPYAWLYLAVALPLTLVVVAVWFAWIWFSGKVEEREVQEGVIEGEKEGTDVPIV